MSNKKLNKQCKDLDVASAYLDITRFLKKDLVSKICVGAVRRYSVSSCLSRRKNYNLDLCRVLSQ